MGRLGKTDANANANANANAGLRVEGLSAAVRYNSQELRKVVNSGFFPFPADEKFQEAQDAANSKKFRKNWDAELRASVYLNEFITRNPDWLTILVGVTAPLHTKLQNEKGHELLRVLEAAGDREERFSEIIDQHEGDGVIKYWLGMLMVDAASAPATYLLIRVARRIGEIVVMCLKDHYREARPSQVCPGIVPMIDPPITPSFPAGHALQSHLISKCLYEAERPRDQREMLFELSKRVAENRSIAGLHYYCDNEAGVLAANRCFDMMRGGTLFDALLNDARAEGQV